MPLPNNDPSLPSNPAPIFNDTEAVRGDQLRANNQQVWGNLEYLDEGQNITDASAATPADADQFGFFQASGSIIKKVTASNLFVWVVSKFYALTAKTTPADADKFFITDSAASNVGKSLTWANIKTALKAYFDTLYQPILTTWMIRYDSFAGYGAAATCIPYFTNKNTDTSGGGITVVNDATNGLKFTCTVAGTYSISFWAYGTAAMYLGVSINSATPSAPVQSLGATELAALSTTTANSFAAFVSWTGQLSVNDVLRPHTDGRASAGNGYWGCALARLS